MTCAICSTQSSDVLLSMKPEHTDCGEYAQTDDLQQASQQLEAETCRLDQCNSATSFEISKAQMGVEAAKNEGKWLRIELDCLRNKVTQATHLDSSVAYHLYVCWSPLLQQPALIMSAAHVLHQACQVQAAPRKSMRLDTRWQQMLPVPSFLQHDLLDAKPTTAELVRTDSVAAFLCTRLHISADVSPVILVLHLASLPAPLRVPQCRCVCLVQASFRLQITPDPHPRSQLPGVLVPQRCRTSAPLRRTPKHAYRHLAPRSGAVPQPPSTDLSSPHFTAAALQPSRLALTGCALGVPLGGCSWSLNRLLDCLPPCGPRPSHAGPHLQVHICRLTGVRGARSSHTQGWACRPQASWTACRCWPPPCRKTTWTCCPSCCEPGGLAPPHLTTAHGGLLLALLRQFPGCRRDLSMLPVPVGDSPATRSSLPAGLASCTE